MITCWLPKAILIWLHSSFHKQIAELSLFFQSGLALKWSVCNVRWWPLMPCLWVQVMGEYVEENTWILSIHTRVCVHGQIHYNLLCVRLRDILDSLSSCENVMTVQKSNFSDTEPQFYCSFWLGLPRLSAKLRNKKLLIPQGWTTPCYFSLINIVGVFFVIAVLYEKCPRYFNNKG